jgi:predicted sulfurtransferase|tara:strand:+ start:127 stop:318 length:192 start_codon:yes stop_codon:yes gene_type:complete
MLPLIRKESMKCKECNKEITKENQKVISGNVGKYRSKCKPCYNKDLKLRYQKKKKAIEESRWF